MSVMHEAYAVGDEHGKTTHHFIGMPDHAAYVEVYDTEIGEREIWACLSPMHARVVCAEISAVAGFTARMVHPDWDITAKTREWQ